jgi:curved DNA-binding protein CbpA
MFFNKNAKFKFCEVLKNYASMDYYTLLSVKQYASENEIRKSYYILAKKYPPDKFKGSVEIFRKITDAYNTLRDINKRDLYNKKIKIKKHKRDETEEKTSEEERKTSLYEEEFKKMNIEKLFFQYDRKKLKHSPNEIKVFKSELERKMSKREFMINEFYRKLQEDDVGKSTKFKIYKKLGYIKEEKEEIKTYDQMVNEEIHNIKNSNTFKEDIKRDKDEELKQAENKDKALKKMMYLFVGFYFISIGIFFLIQHNRKKSRKDVFIANKKKEDSDRLKSYQYFG